MEKTRKKVKYTEMKRDRREYRVDRREDCECQSEREREREAGAAACLRDVCEWHLAIRHVERP